MGVIDPEMLAAEGRRLRRMVMAQLLTAMAEADMGPAELAEVLGCDKRFIWRWVRRMIDGSGKDLQDVSNIAATMGRRLTVELRDI